MKTVVKIFLASVLGLILELALIRWVSSEIRIFAYCKNLVLIACFLGFGTGCLLRDKPVRLLGPLISLLLLLLVIQIRWKPLAEFGPRHISGVLAQMPGLMVFQAVGSELTWDQLPGIIFAVLWTIIIFFVLAFIMVPWGKIIAASIGEIPNALRGYSINVFGSLTGIVIYTLMTAAALPPAVWFAPVSLACVLFEEKHTKAILFVTLGIIAVMIPNQMPADHVFWSSYQKLQVRGNHVTVNDIGYQAIGTMPEVAKGHAPLNRLTMPYFVRLPPGKVLIIGAGVGNDIAVSIGAGADSITAVEIDPMIVEFGRKLHPQAPYNNERVATVIDDARHFLRVNQSQYDLIVFSHVDSHTTLSSYTNVRLDDYLYTVESFKEARKHLTSDGFLYLSYWVEQPYVGYRLRENCTIAFGHPPVTMFQKVSVNNSQVTLAHFLTAEKHVMPHLIKVASQWPWYTSESFPIKPSTDNWPFLALSKPHIPALVLILSFIILLLCGLFVWRTRPPGEPFAGCAFWLGAGFLLLEVHNVSRLALCFGTTWQVNAWTIGAILGTILLSNQTYEALKSRKFFSNNLVTAMLFISLAVAYWVPVEIFLSYPHLVGRAGATIMLTLPIYFAGLLFADTFMNSSKPGFTLGWNVLGAVVGGMSEGLSFIFGIPFLIVLASCFYTMAFLYGRNLRTQVGISPVVR